MCKAEDKISNLPDEILHHILSFLGVKIVARTSLLSHRWKYIWTSIPNLEFYFGFKYSTTKKFMNFVDGTLHRRSLSSNIGKFYLNSAEHLDESRINSWISNVLRHKVKKLGLFLHQAHPLFLPLAVFSCESLTSLMLQTHPVTRFPKCFTFPRFKQLELHRFGFSNDCWNENIFSDSPVLEELRLFSCSFHMTNFCISVPSLKLLSITLDESGIQDCVLKIHAPSLVELSYSGDVAKGYILSSFFTLEEASVFFRHDGEDATTVLMTGHEEAVSQFFRALVHVKSLGVYATTLQAICFADERFNHRPTFHNIKHLDLLYVPSDEKSLPALLKLTPNLESLELQMHAEEVVNSVEGEENHDSEGEGDATGTAEEHGNAESGDSHGNEVDGWTPGMKLMAGNLFIHLKSVNFQFYSGEPKQMWWVKQILMNAKALQSVTFLPRATVPNEHLMEIPKFSRAAANCLFTFCFVRNQKWEYLKIRSSKDSGTSRISNLHTE